MDAQTPQQTDTAKKIETEYTAFLAALGSLQMSQEQLVAAYRSALERKKMAKLQDQINSIY